jgi:hypothetical protein
MSLYWGIELEKESFSDPPHQIPVDTENGKLNWFQANDRTFKLTFGEIIAKQMQNLTCEKRSGSEPYDYQKMVPAYAGYGTPTRGLLLYHPMGKGKSRSAALWIKSIMDATSGIRVIIMSPASLADGFIGEVDKWIGTKYSAKLAFIPYNGRPLDELARYGIGIDEHGTMHPPKNCAFVIDEVHNFINKVINPHNKTHNLYKILMAAENCKFLALSGTPIVNSPLEAAYLFNILKGPMLGKYHLLPTDSEILMKNYISTGYFAECITGMVSHFSDSVFDDRMPRLDFQQTTDLYLSTSQFDIYQERRQRERQMESRHSDTENKELDVTEVPAVRQFTRPICNLVFPSNIPYIGSLPTKLVPNPRKPEDPGTKYYIFDGCDMLASHPVFEELIRENMGETELTNLEIAQAIYREGIVFNEKKYTNLLEAYAPGEYKRAEMESRIHMMMEVHPSMLTKDLAEYSPKFAHILANTHYNVREDLDDDNSSWVLDETPNDGIVFCYSFYKTFEGAITLGIALELNGYEEVDPVNPGLSLETPGPRFVVMSGDTTDGNNAIRIAVNSPINKYGEYIKFVIGTGVSAEGISYHNVRKLFVLEPHWNNVRMEQVIGRTRRIDSHKNLAPELQQVTVEILCIKFSPDQLALTTEDMTADEYVSSVAAKKDVGIRKILSQITTASIETILTTGGSIKIDSAPSTFYPYLYVPDKAIYTPMLVDAFVLEIGSVTPIHVLVNLHDAVRTKLARTANLGTIYELFKCYSMTDRREFVGYVLYNTEVKLKRLINSSELVN